MDFLGEKEQETFVSCGVTMSVGRGIDFGQSRKRYVVIQYIFPPDKYR